MPTMTLPPPAKFQAFDSNGDPLSSGKLYTSVSGSDTPLATYTDVAGGTENANPVVLDSRGEASVWLTPLKTYRLVLKTSADVTIWTVDGIVGTPSTASIQNSAMTYLGSIAGTNTITAVAAPVIPAYAAGQLFSFIPANTNTGATTINIDSLGAKSVFFARTSHAKSNTTVRSSI
jgi:hypothetical protein